MKKLIYLASFLCALHLPASQSSTPTINKPSIPKEFTVLHSQSPTEKDDLSQHKKTDCFFYILISAPSNAKNDTKTKGDSSPSSGPLDKTGLYKIFSNVTKEQQGALIPQDFIKPGVPEVATAPTYTLHFGWADKGGKNNLPDAALSLTKALTRLHQNFKKSNTCYYLIVTEGRSGLLINYATQNLLKSEAFSLSVVVEIGTPLPTDKANKELFYPQLFKIGTMYSLYTQHAYKLSNVAHFPPAPQTSYPQAFIDKHTNLYNVRLLLNNNQRSLQGIFEGQDLKQPFAYLGQHIFEYCNFIKRAYSYHHDLWATIDTRKNGTPFIGIMTHPSRENESSKAIQKEHLLAGKQKKGFKETVGPSTDTRINMSDRAKMQSNVRSVAHVKKLQKLTCQTA